MPSLFVIRGNDQGTRFELAERTTGVGRDGSNTVQLHDTEVSRQHARIVASRGAYVLADLGSSNGTYVNGAAVKEHRLRSGDQIQMGGTLMLYTQPADEESAERRGRVDIAFDEPGTERSRIVHSMAHAEGSRIFDLSTDGRQNAWLARARSNLQVMYRTALAVSHTLDIDELLSRIMELVFEWVDVDRGCIMLVDPDTKDLASHVRLTRASHGENERITISRTILDYVMERREGVLTSDAQQDDRWNPAASIVQTGIREAICVPMQGRYDLVGVLYLDTLTAPQDVVSGGKAGTHKLTEDHLKLLIAIAHQAALAVEDTRYYSAMVQAERLAAIGQTIATLSHHIKNILQGIRGGSYLIEMGLTQNDPDVVRKGWAIVEKNQGKISSLVMDMLTFSKEREPDLVPTQINEVVSDVVELIEGRAKELHVTLTWQPDERVPTLILDPEGMHRAILNVVSNGLDATADPPTEGNAQGEVRVSTVYLVDTCQLQVVVEDNGPGMPKDQMEQLFSPFVSFKKGARGTGLGLAVSQKIVTEHGGRIRVDSEPGKGSRFVLELPAVLPGEGPATLALEEPPPPL